MQENTNPLNLNLEQITIDPVSISMGAGIGLLCGLLLLFWRESSRRAENAALKAQIDAERAGLEAQFKSLAQETLQSNAENFLNIAQEKMKVAQANSAHDLDKRTQAIAEMVKPVEKHLQQLNGAVEQLSGTDKAIREDIQNLSKETSRLTGALKNPAAQGKWGEFVLERLLDKANLMKGVHYKTQVSIDTDDGRLRPDAVIYLQDGFNIVVDAKAPITEFINQLDQEQTIDDLRAMQTSLAKTVRTHVKALGSKAYWDQLDGPDFVVLFLPSEHIFSTALAADPDLIDFASDNNVIIASPTLLMSLLRVVGLSWRQVEMAKNAQDISKLGADLFDRITSFTKHLDKVGKGLESALGAYNKSVGTLDNRVLATAKKFKEMQSATGPKEIEQPRMLEQAIRPITNLENSDKDETKDEDVNYG